MIYMGLIKKLPNRSGPSKKQILGRLYPVFNVVYNWMNLTIIFTVQFANDNVTKTTPILICRQLYPFDDSWHMNNSNDSLFMTLPCWDSYPMSSVLKLADEIPDDSVVKTSDSGTWHVLSMIWGRDLNPDQVELTVPSTSVSVVSKSTDKL